MSVSILVDRCSLRLSTPFLSRVYMWLQSQWAPYNAFYVWDNVTYAEIYEPSTTVLNEYRGGVYQQTTSALSTTNQDCYELNTGCHAVYGFEYKPGYAEDSKSTITAHSTLAHRVQALISPGSMTVKRSGAQMLLAWPQTLLPKLVLVQYPKNRWYVLYLSFFCLLSRSLTLISVCHSKLGLVRKFRRDRLWGIDIPNPHAHRLGPGIPTSWSNQYRMWSPKLPYHQLYWDLYWSLHQPQSNGEREYNTQRAQRTYIVSHLQTWTDDYGQPFPKNRLIDEC